MSSKMKKIIGRVLTALVSAAFVVFAVMGQVPTWWEGLLAIAVPIINIIIGKWNPPTEE